MSAADDFNSRRASLVDEHTSAKDRSGTARLVSIDATRIADLSLELPRLKA